MSKTDLVLLLDDYINNGQKTVNFVTLCEDLYRNRNQDLPQRPIYTNFFIRSYLIRALQISFDGIYLGAFYFTSQRDWKLFAGMIALMAMFYFLVYGHTNNACTSADMDLKRALTSTTQYPLIHNWQEEQKLIKLAADQLGAQDVGRSYVPIHDQIDIEKLRNSYRKNF